MTNNSGLVISSIWLQKISHEKHKADAGIQNKFGRKIRKRISQGYWNLEIQANGRSCRSTGRARAVHYWSRHEIRILREANIESGLKIATVTFPKATNPALEKWPLSTNYWFKEFAVTVPMNRCQLNFSSLSRSLLGRTVVGKRQSSNVCGT